MPIDYSHLDPRCQHCQEKDCANCTQFGAPLMLTDPPAPWLSGEPLKRPKAPLPWEQLSWMKE